MFCLNRQPILCSKLSKVLRDATNKEIDKHFKNKSFTRLLVNKNILPTDIVPTDIVPCFLLLPIVSLIFFLAGYNYYKLKMITN
jgi:hypothetical protein